MGLQWLMLVLLMADEIGGAFQCFDCQGGLRRAMKSEKVDVAFAAIAEATEIVHSLMR